MEKKYNQMKSSMGGKKSDSEDAVQGVPTGESLATIRKPAPSFTADAWW